MAGNANPPVTIPMERGEVGVNHVMAKERLLFVTGRPVEPHSAKADCHFLRHSNDGGGVGLASGCERPSVAE